jgi:hypothetical protein
MEDNYLLTFELTKNKDELEIHTNSKGLKRLIAELEILLQSAEKGVNDHNHLMTEEWAGNELSSIAQGGELLNHVKVYYWSDK